jgi:hypothetical protein
MKRNPIAKALRTRRNLKKELLKIKKNIIEKKIIKLFK